ncbi:MAG: ComEC/Rec2 family competence protein, partial [Clostridia bacterium]|nr:ComEC/Rec2 family competence protein [Clostridia bacterium]
YNYDALTSLAAAFFSIVLFNPAAVFNIGFQLSFASVFAIFTIHGSFAGTKVQRNPFLSSFVMSAATFLGTWLIISNINNRINLVSLLVNPPAVMITGATVPVVAAATLIYCVFGGFTVNFGYPGIFLIGITNKIAALAEKADFAVVKMPAIPPEAILASFAIIFILSKFISAKPFSKAVAAALIAALIPVSFFAYSLGGNALRIDVLSDRFANSAVITDGSGDCWLIDAGSRSAFDYTEDYGLKPKAVFVTGARSKSVGGLEYFVDSDIYVPANTISDERLSGLNIICLEGGERISLTDEISITTFADKDASHISYHIKRGENTVMTLLAVSPDDEVYRTKADVIFVNSYSKATARYVYECGPDCVIIKENGVLDADLAVPLINAVHAGRVSVLSNDKTRVVSRYEG